MFGGTGTELGLIHQVEAGWTTLHTADVVLEYRNLKYNKIIIIKNLHLISLLVGLSGPRLKKKARVKQHKFTAFQNTQQARNRHYSARTHSDGSCRKISFILCQTIHWI